MALAAIRSKAVVLLLLIRCWLLLPMWDSWIVLCFVVRYFVSTIVLQSSRWGRELVALLCLSSWWLVIVVWLSSTMPRVCLQLVIVVIPDHTHFLFCVFLLPTSLHELNWFFTRCHWVIRGRKILPFSKNSFKALVSCFPLFYIDTNTIDSWHEWNTKD